MIFKQPNGLYGRVSSVVDAPTHVDMTKKEVRDYLVESSQLHHEISVDGWLNSFEGQIDDAVNMVTNLNMTDKEIEEWKNKIGYKEGSE